MQFERDSVFENVPLISPNDHFLILFLKSNCCRLFLGFDLLTFLALSERRFFSGVPINVELKNVEVNGETDEVGDAEEGNEELPKMRILRRRIDVDGCDAQNDETDDGQVEQRPNDPVGYCGNL